MMAFRILISAAAVLLISGCASVKYNYNSEAINISEPPLDSVSTAYVGDEMLKQGTFRLHDAIVLSDEIKVGGLAKYTLHPGEYIKHGQDEKAGYYNVGQTENPGLIRKCALCDSFKSVMAYNDEPKLCVVTVFSAMVCGNGIRFDRRQVPIVAADSFQQTLIYSGKVGDKVNVGYREFSNNSARPAFNNDVEYDLSTSNTIGYKGAQLQVIEATNEYIKYRVIRNFNRAAI